MWRDAAPCSGGRRSTRKRSGGSTCSRKAVLATCWPSARETKPSFGPTAASRARRSACSSTPADLRAREAAVGPKEGFVSLADGQQVARTAFREQVDPPERFRVDRRPPEHGTTSLQIESAEVTLHDDPRVELLLRVESTVDRCRLLRQDERLASDGLHLPKEGFHRVNDRLLDIPVPVDDKQLGPAREREREGTGN